MTILTQKAIITRQSGLKIHSFLDIDMTSDWETPGVPGSGRRVGYSYGASVGLTGHTAIEGLQAQYDPNFASVAEVWTDCVNYAAPALTASAAFPVLQNALGDAAMNTILMSEANDASTISEGSAVRQFRLTWVATGVTVGTYDFHLWTVPWD